MDLELARSLSELNNRFYQQAAPSFSATRRAGWAGWERLCDVCGIAAGDHISLVDLACGNLRFERYLQDRGVTCDAWTYDNCDELVGMKEVVGVRYRHLDVMEVLLSDTNLSSVLDAPASDLAVAFGFLHHVPMQKHRIAVVRTLLDHAKVGGFVAVSLWQFATDERIFAKATPVRDGEPGDYLLGWQDSDLKRYCHSFSEDEQNEMIDAVADLAEPLALYTADGKTGELNRYVVLRRR